MLAMGNQNDHQGPPQQNNDANQNPARANGPQAEQRQPRMPGLVPLRVGIVRHLAPGEQMDEDENGAGQEDYQPNAVEHNLAALIEAFPYVRPAFLENALRSNAGNVDATAAWIIDQPAADVPKRPAEEMVAAPRNDDVEDEEEENQAKDGPGNIKMKHFNSWAHFQRTNFYSQLCWQNLDRTDQENHAKTSYKKQAEVYLKNDFKWISVQSLQDAFKRFGFRYSMVHRVLNDGLSQMLAIKGWTPCDLWQIKQTEVFIDAPSEQTRLTLEILAEPRKKSLQDCMLEENPLLAKEMEWMKIKSEREQAIRRTKPEDMIECVICANDYEFDEMRSCAGGHQFCRTCVELYADEAILAQGKPSLKCMLEDCDHNFARATLKATLMPQRIKQMEEREMQLSVAAAGFTNLTKCRECGFAVTIDESPMEMPVYTCPGCKKAWCRLCGLPYDYQHVGKTCEEARGNRVDERRKEFEELMTKEIIRDCPKCSAPIVKLEGCNKMTCSTCGTKFCYLCKTGDIGYDHFCKHPLDPGQKRCNQCNGCLLHENPQTRDEANLRDLEQQKQAALQILEAQGKAAEAQHQRIKATKENETAQNRND